MAGIVNVKKISRSAELLKSHVHRIEDLKGHYAVPSASRPDEAYTVIVNKPYARRLNVSCSCPAGLHYRGCKHIMAVCMHLAEKQSRRVSFWLSAEEAQRQHRPICRVNDFYMTGRLDDENGSAEMETVYFDEIDKRQQAYEVVLDGYPGEQWPVTGHIVQAGTDQALCGKAVTVARYSPGGSEFRFPGGEYEERILTGKLWRHRVGPARFCSACQHELRRVFARDPMPYSGSWPESTF